MQAALKRLLAEGHELGSHAAEHVYLSTLSPAAAQQQILWAIANITAVTGNKSVPVSAVSCRL
jgi:peptidoglycan/xylan/chitin deacetylase (PgdA/CDA1 family)